MNIAIASGKGGTGKTTISVNLALSLDDAQLLDCDVEEPNCNIFLGYNLVKKDDVNILTPVIDKNNCNFCGKCADFCQFNAIAVLPGDIMLFNTLCHGCGGCGIVCPMDAIDEEKRSIGTIEKSETEYGNLEFFQGLLNIGEAMASPVIKDLKKNINKNKNTIIDAPPGTACPAIATLEDTDYCILVTEPTPFGYHDLLLTLDVVRELGIPFGIIINRCDVGDSKVEEFCYSENIPVLMKIPYDKNIAQLYSNGIPFVQKMPEWKKQFAQMFESIQSIDKY
ncbi:Cobyrinic acid ac-diamide synthase [Methanohalobium evestigatum Z-7303]|uniref:Cobyrinic acid ac-diamide synthase n=1 Tax=Methanohalobium evestigatum (strain ATCC BAA-1072 / DSM 3721 / NBRC 107634 / OCM 161 / Z-7303) TaxID=644295 RepID=D7EBT2_METEZ|nr:ATP-binding protein [Methanohalobium evestigatum]ADI74924.1 Cobyrinic acid ac-diamide synthase [Methanohalobium evestigatum Z-7303]